MLPLPPLLSEMLETGRWPRDSREANAQNLRSLADRERVRLLAPGEERLFLYPPPFATVSEHRRAEGEQFWGQMADPDGINPDLALVIGDFGLGSDAPILLDYRYHADDPRVLRLRWHPHRVTKWEPLAPDFLRFVEVLGL